MESGGLFDKAYSQVDNVTYRLRRTAFFAAFLAGFLATFFLATFLVAFLAAFLAGLFFAVGIFGACVIGDTDKGSTTKTSLKEQTG